MFASNLTDHEMFNLTGCLSTDRIRDLLDRASQLEDENHELRRQVCGLTDRLEQEIPALLDEIKRLKAELSPFEFRQYTIGSHFLSAIINDDWTGLTDGEDKDLRRFTYTQVGEFWTTDPDDEEARFAKCEVTGLMCNCVTALLAVRKPNR